jgi:23S rRNA (adenine2503-C2)-methyltransferase
MRFIAGTNEEALKEILKNKYGAPEFRAAQIIGWMYKGAGFDQMSNVPSSLREKMKADFAVFPLTLKDKLEEKKTKTIKYIFETIDGILVETVVLAYEHGAAVCVSSQAGCRMGCAFCVSGKGGLIRNLSAAEMLSEVILAQRDIGRRINTVVLMGSGEPLDNYNQVRDFIRLLNDPDGLNIGIRNITVSTCGVAKGIWRLIDDRLFVNLSLSLHAPLHELRLKIMPAERAYPLDEVIEACKAYRAASSRRVTLEYCLIEGFNDTPECAKALQSLIRDTDMLLNLIDVNEGGGLGKNSAACMRNFCKLLKNLNINYTIRRKLGSSINAACGQLQSRYAEDTHHNGGGS